MTAPISVNDGRVAGRGEEDATRRRRDDDENNGGGHGRGDGRGDGEKMATVSRGAPQSGGSCEGTPTATTTTMACEYMYMYLPSDGCTDCATAAEDCSAGGK